MLIAPSNICLDFHTITHFTGWETQDKKKNFNEQESQKQNHMKEMMNYYLNLARYTNTTNDKPPIQ